jgi:hypothetical protein
MNDQKLYTEEQVIELIKTAVECSCTGVKNWIDNESTITITFKGNPKPMREYIYPLLDEKGIKFIFKGNPV